MTVLIGPCSKSFNPWAINNGAAIGQSQKESVEPGSGALACCWQLQLGREETPVDEALIDQPLWIQG